MDRVKASCRVVQAILIRLTSSCFEANPSKVTTHVQHLHGRSFLSFRAAFAPMAAHAKTILSQLLLALQFSLGVWQIIKFTPLGGLLECMVKRWMLLPLGFSTPYARLHGFPGRMYKTVTCHILISSSSAQVLDVANASFGEQADDPPTGGAPIIMAVEYLQENFTIQRRGDELFVNGAMAYYLTDAVWPSVVEMAKAAPRTVFLKGYKEFWQQVATGGVMSLWEVLDGLILDNLTLLKLDNDLFLPVNLSVSEEKLLKFLNLAGLFLQTKPVLWLYPSLLTFTAAVLEFCTPLRVWLYNKANQVLCWAIQAVAENVLSRQWRRQVYALGLWVKNLKPSNDIELKVVKGRDVWAVIAGGAKVPFCKEGSASVVPFDDDDDDDDDDDAANDMEMEKKGSDRVCKACWVCYPEDEDGDHTTNKKVKAAEQKRELASSTPTILPTRTRNAKVEIKVEAHFYTKQKKCWVRASTVAVAEVDCTFAEFKRLKTFLSCVAKHRSGSLKTYDAHGKVRVRSFRESVLCYVLNKCPTVYEMHLGKVTVK